MNTLCSGNYFLKKRRLIKNFFSKELVNIEIVARIFFDKDKMKRFSLKIRRDKDDFENDLETLFSPVNESVDEVASARSEFLNNNC